MKCNLKTLQNYKKKINKEEGGKEMKKRIKMISLKQLKIWLMFCKLKQQKTKYPSIKQCPYVSRTKQ